MNTGVFFLMQCTRTGSHGSVAAFASFRYCLVVLSSSVSATKSPLVVFENAVGYCTHIQGTKLFNQ